MEASAITYVYIKTLKDTANVYRLKCDQKGNNTIYYEKKNVLVIKENFCYQIYSNSERSEQFLKQVFS